MAKVKVGCAYCGHPTSKEAGAITRARKIGAPIYCDRRCSGLARRAHRTDAEKRLAKKIYDVEYRQRNSENILAREAEYHLRTYDPEKARVRRKARAAQHIEYCRRQEYREYKQRYDLTRRASAYGPFTGAYLCLLLLDREVNARMSDYDVRITNGTLNKRTKRKREYRNTVGSKSQEVPLGNP